MWVKEKDKDKWRLNWKFIKNISHLLRKLLETMKREKKRNKSKEANEREIRSVKFSVFFGAAKLPSEAWTCKTWLNITTVMVHTFHLFQPVLFFLFYFFKSLSSEYTADCLFSIFIPCNFAASSLPIFVFVRLPFHGLSKRIIRKSNEHNKFFIKIK